MIELTVAVHGQKKFGRCKVNGPQCVLRQAAGVQPSWKFDDADNSMPVISRSGRWNRRAGAGLGTGTSYTVRNQLAQVATFQPK